MTIVELISWCKRKIKQGDDVEALRSILNLLKGLEKPKQPPHPYHNQAVQAYKEFLSKHGLPPVFDFRQGGALREILYKLDEISTEKRDERALLSFKYILNNWHKLDDFLQKHKTPQGIKKYLLEIIDAIKNGKTTSTSNRKNNTTAHTSTGRNDFGKL